MAKTSTKNKIRTLLIIISIINIVTVLCGVLFRLNHWQGGSVMLILGLSLAVYIWIGFIVYRCIVGHNPALQSPVWKCFRITAHVFLAFFGGSLILGLLFAINHWPGWQLMLSMGIVGTIVSSIMILVFRNKKQEDKLINFQN